jgi:site-specific DNA-methyltransferase (adenine-specific)
MIDLDAILARGGPWQRAERIGGQLLLQGDCREVMAALPKVDAVVTDPPYGIGLVKKTSDFRDSVHFDKGETLKASRLYDDAPDKIAALLKTAVPVAIAMAQRALFFSGPAMLWHYPEPASIGSVFTPNGAGRCAWGFQCTHPVLFYGKDPFLQDGMGGRPNSWRTEQPNTEKIDHPCPKPVAWMEWALNRATRPGEAVLDPFMGSGTTLVACQRLGRQGIGIELDAGYFDIACRRVDEAARQPALFHPEPPPKPTQEALL